MSPARSGRQPVTDDDLHALMHGLEPEEIAALVSDLPEHLVSPLLASLEGAGAAAPQSPLDQALATEPTYRRRDHLEYISRTITEAVHDVEAGTSRRLIIELPPRSGKTLMTTQFTPLWLLGRHPDWPMALVSHDPGLATSWGRQIRRWVETGSAASNVAIAPDAGAVGGWETTAGGTVMSRSTRGSLTGRGAKVMLIDDPHKDFVDAHSAVERERVWNWWLTVAQPRLEPPSLVIVIMTRWHEDDLVGRLLSREHEGNPDDWTRVRLPALADDPADPLDRADGDPLFSPLLDEDREEALARWEGVRADVGSYAFAALYQQRPSPAKGSIFDAGWWRYWTTDPSRVTYDENGDEDGRVVLLNPVTDLSGAHWLDSWDAAFKETSTSDWVVGQRWARQGPRRYLIAQQRARMSFTKTVAALRAWAVTDPDDHGYHPTNHLVHQRLIEDKANGSAIIDTLQDLLSGIKPINPTTSKIARARAVTPEVESGHVYLPHPSDHGHEWVTELLSELRNFPVDAHDDQVDALTQALGELRTPGRGGATVPGGTPPSERTPTPYAAARIDRNLTSTARRSVSSPLPGRPSRAAVAAAAVRSLPSTRR